LLWWLENGSKIEDLEKLAASGKKIKTLEQRPQVLKDLQDVWQAFIDLSSSRQIGFEENPILISEIEAWLNIQGISSLEVRKEYFRIVKTLDSIRMGWIRKRQCQTKNKKPV
jgi:hypothetical protein